MSEVKPENQADTLVTSVLPQFLCEQKSIQEGMKHANFKGLGGRQYLFGCKRFHSPVHTLLVCEAFVSFTNKSSQKPKLKYHNKRAPLDTPKPHPSSELDNYTE